MEKYRKKYLKYKKKYLKMKYGGENLITIDIGNKFKGNFNDNKIEFIKIIKENGLDITQDETYYYKYFCKIKIDDIIDLCIIYIFRTTNDIVLNFIDKNCEEKISTLTMDDINNLSFIILYFNETDTITTDIEFDTNKKQTKLERIFTILETLYEYLNYESIKLIDDAKFKCPQIINEEKEKCTKKVDIKRYSAILYRIFMTNNDINSLSIYSKYGYINDCDNVQHLLDNIRTQQISDIFSIFKDRDIYDNIFKKSSYNNMIKDFISKIKDNNQNFCEYFKQYDITNISNCSNMLEELNIIDKIINQIDFKKYKENNSFTQFFNNLKQIKICISSLNKSIKKN